MTFFITFLPSEVFAAALTLDATLVEPTAFLAAPAADAILPAGFSGAFEGALDIVVLNSSAVGLRGPTIGFGADALACSSVCNLGDLVRVLFVLGTVLFLTAAVEGLVFGVSTIFVEPFGVLVLTSLSAAAFDILFSAGERLSVTFAVPDVWLAALFLAARLSMNPSNFLISGFVIFGALGNDFSCFSTDLICALVTFGFEVVVFFAATGVTAFVNVVAGRGFAARAACDARATLPRAISCLRVSISLPSCLYSDLVPTRCFVGNLPSPLAKLRFFWINFSLAALALDVAPRVLRSFLLSSELSLRVKPFIAPGRLFILLLTVRASDALILVRCVAARFAMFLFAWRWIASFCPFVSAIILVQSLS